MRVLQTNELVLVSAGATLAELAENACSGLPNGATVTVEQSLGSSVGYDSTNANNQTSQSVTVNCGDLRGGGGSSSGGTSSGASGSWGGGSSGVSGSWEDYCLQLV